MEELNKDILSKAIANLPTFTTESDKIWGEIEKTLDASRPNQELIDNLPEFKLPKDIWPEIEAKIDKKQPKTVFIKIVKVAAAILLLLSSAVIIKQVYFSKSTKGEISYSVETIQDDGTAFTPELKISGNSHIQAICLNNPVACNSEAFKELNQQINDLNNELDKLSKLLIENNDPQLQRYYYKLENQKTDIEIQMIKIINQS